MHYVKFQLAEDYQYTSQVIPEKTITVPEGTVFTRSGYTSLYITELPSPMLGLPFLPMFTLDHMLKHPNTFKKIVQ
jgi:hypothetical protein